MKARISKLSTIAIVVVAALSIGLFVGCKEEEESINNPLKNTEWKLIGFVDIENNTTKAPEPSDNICYTLAFDGTLDKLNLHTSTNSLTGDYTIDTERNSLFIENLYGTEINELYDGDLFMQGIKSVSHYSISSNTLKLYYNSHQNYLEFIRKEL